MYFITNNPVLNQIQLAERINTLVLNQMQLAERTNTLVLNQMQLQEGISTIVLNKLQNLEVDNQQRFTDTFSGFTAKIFLRFASSLNFGL